MAIFNFLLQSIRLCTLVIISFLTSRFLLGSFFPKKYSIQHIVLVSLSTFAFGLFYFNTPYSFSLQLWIQLFIALCLYITTLTDSFALLISPLVTLYPIGLVLCASYYGYGTTSFYTSLSGSFICYASFWGLSYLAETFLKKPALGEGDIDLFALIGSLVGIIGAVHILFLSSLLGSLYGITIGLLQNKPLKNLQLPFGTFLSASTLVYLVYGQNLLRFIVH